MHRLVLALLAATVLLGCSTEKSTQSEPPDRDGVAPQMGVMAGDPNDYGN